MNAVSGDVSKLVEKELESANAKFPQFQSEHEAWAVMREEIDECEEAGEMLKTENEYLWFLVKCNRGQTDGIVKEIREIAEQIACEAIQVAAMAQKYLDMLESLSK